MKFTHVLRLARFIFLLLAAYSAAMILFFLIGAAAWKIVLAALVGMDFGSEPFRAMLLKAIDADWIRFGCLMWAWGFVIQLGIFVSLFRSVGSIGDPSRVEKTMKDVRRAITLLISSWGFGLIMAPLDYRLAKASFIFSSIPEMRQGPQTSLGGTFAQAAIGQDLRGVSALILALFLYALLRFLRERTHLQREVRRLSDDVSLTV